MHKTTPELRYIQEKCLEILNIVDKICERHNIQYSLCGGSVVGAYLYKGIIPWDDDVDLMMTRNNYEKFIRVASDELPEYYEIQNYKKCKDYTTLFTKIVDSRTTLVQLDNQGKKVVNGIFLDITVYDKVPHNIFQKLDFKLAMLTQKILYCDISQGKGITKSLVRIIGNRCSKLFIIVEYLFRIFGRCKQYSYCELYGAFCNSKLYPPNIFENYIKIEFEGKEYGIVKDYIEYLENRYERTDFYEPEDKQTPPHYYYVDFNLPYREYKK